MTDFHEDDEDPKAIRAAFDAGVHGVTAHPALHVSDPHVGTTTRVETDVTDESVTARTLRIMREEWTAPFRAALEAAQDEIRTLRYQHAAIHETLEATYRDAWDRHNRQQDEIQRLTRQRDNARDLVVRSGYFQSDRHHLGGPLRDALLNDGVCPPCSTGDHSGHRAELAGVCVGCACEGAS